MHQVKTRALTERLFRISAALIETGHYINRRAPPALWTPLRAILSLGCHGDEGMMIRTPVFQLDACGRNRGTANPGFRALPQELGDAIFLSGPTTRGASAAQCTQWLSVSLETVSE
jgi:hypothetical protein